MKIDLTQPIRNFDGEPLKNGDQELTFGILFRNLLGAPIDKDSGDKKLRKYKLGIKCVADSVDLDLEERKLLKDTVDKAGVNPLIYGRVTEILDPPGNE